MVVTEAWFAILELSAASGEDNFFALVGSSIAAAMLTQCIASKLSIEIPLEAVCLNAELSSLIAECEQILATSGRVVPAVAGTRTRLTGGWRRRLS